MSWIISTVAGLVEPSMFGVFVSFGRLSTHRRRRRIWTCCGPTSLLRDLLHIMNTAGLYVNHSNRFGHPVLRGPMINHIPKSARQHCASQLKLVLYGSINNPNDDMNALTRLVNFGSAKLVAPPRSSKKHNLTSLLKFRLASDSLTEPVVRASNKRIRNTDTALAAFATSKIGDGNINSAPQILCSNDKPVADSETIIVALKERHPSAASNRQPSPALRDFADFR